MTEVRTSKVWDVAILGTGIGGTILGAILAKHGLKVLLLEQAAHPRFAIGESTVPETTFLFRVLAERYGVPEIGYLSTYQLVRRHVAASCGIKRNFSFVYHRPNEPQRPHETTQFPTFAPPFGPDMHMYRQDVDAYMLSVAVSYGAALRQKVDVTDVSFSGDGVLLKTSAGEEIQARFVVDAGGLKSMLARKLDLRQEPCPLKTRSRTLYTHMVGVRPYDACIADRSAHGLPSPLSQGTLHHIFDRGWMWVIPFDNYPLSTNRLVSVGLQFDLDRHPRLGLSPEDEFRQFIRAYPSLAMQFEHATAIQPWAATDRLQFSSTRSVGYRFAMLPHAFGFVDPLFSSGLGITMAAINVLGARIIKAAADDDFSAERFEDVDKLVKRGLSYYDRLVSGSYVAFSNFELWNAWYRLWMVGTVFGTLGVMEVLHRLQQNKHLDAASICEQYPYRGVQACELAEFAELFSAGEMEVDKVREGTQSPETAAANIFRAVNESGLWPWGTALAERRHPGGFTLWPTLKTGLWVRYRSPANIREHYFASAKLPSLLGYVFEDWYDELQHSSKGVLSLSRDLIANWNSDWAAQSPPH